MNVRVLRDDVKKSLEEKRQHLKDVVEECFGSIAEFSRVSGIGASSLSRYLSGKGELRLDLWERAFDYAGSPIILVAPDGYETIISTLSEEEKTWLDRTYWRTGEYYTYGGNPENFESLVESSLSEPKEVRQERINKAEKVPRKNKVEAEVFKRNPDVVAEVLSRANGFCEYCNSPAPFLRGKDGSPYLEVHHEMQLAQGGEDTVENAVALCPNCHRKAHFG